MQSFDEVEPQSSSWMAARLPLLPQQRYRPASDLDGARTHPPNSQEGFVLCCVVVVQAGNVVEEISLKGFVLSCCSRLLGGYLRRPAGLVAILDAIFLRKRDNYALVALLLLVARWNWVFPLSPRHRQG